MREYYAGYSADKIDLLISMPSFAILLVMIVNVFWSSYLSERLMVIGGLILYVTAGLMPLFCRDYTFVLVTRFLMGTGTGMVNSRAVSAISERYEGKTREKLLGYRGSVEALGNAVLTMIAGLLLMTGWKNVFYIYGVGIIILILYLTGVPAEKQKQGTCQRKEQSRNMRLSLPRRARSVLSRRGKCLVRKPQNQGATQRRYIEAPALTRV